MTRHVVIRVDYDGTKQTQELVEVVSSQKTTPKEVQAELNHQLFSRFVRESDRYCPYVADDGFVYPRFILESRDFLTPNSAFVGSQTVDLSLDGLNCPACKGACRGGAECPGRLGDK